MTRSDSTAIDELWESAAQWSPVFSPDEQRAGNILHRELAKGEPVTIARLARALGAPDDTAQALAKRLGAESVYPRI